MKIHKKYYCFASSQNILHYLLIFYCWLYCQDSFVEIKQKNQNLSAYAQTKVSMNGYSVIMMHQGAILFNRALKKFNLGIL